MQRTRELGIRMSLGARRTEILALVIRQGMAPVVIGIAVGEAAATASSRAVATFLCGISPLDPLTFAAVAALALGVALVALSLPAWQRRSIPCWRCATRNRYVQSGAVHHRQHGKNRATRLRLF